MTENVGHTSFASYIINGLKGIFVSIVPAEYLDSYSHLKICVITLHNKYVKPSGIKFNERQSVVITLT